MQLSNAPSKIVLPFAASGGKTNPIPVASQIGITNGAASYTDGFPPLTRTPIAAGGVPPFGVDMNGILYAISALSLWQNAGASFPWDSSFATNTNVGGYPNGAQVLRSDNKGFWFNQADNNETNPESSPTGWIPGFSSGVAAITMTNANVTLTPLQYGLPIIEITGTLTANVQLIFPNIAGEWTILNNTTGAFTINGKTASGTGVTLGQGVSTVLTCDGSNVMYTVGSISGALLAANNLSDVANVATARSNLGVLAKANNLSDVANLATALVNLGFVNTSGSYFYIPNPNNTAKPWIVQFGTTPGASAPETITFPIPFPNSVVLITGSCISNSALYAYLMIHSGSVTLSSFGADYGSAAHAPAYWVAIGN